MTSEPQKAVSFNVPEDDLFGDKAKKDKPKPNPENAAGQEQSRAKRIACVVCRRRKLKCDGTRPSCGTCSRLGHDCAYDEVRRKSGPKRGYVKALEARLAQMEALLKAKEAGLGSQQPVQTSTLSTNPGAFASSDREDEQYRTSAQRDTQYSAEMHSPRREVTVIPDYLSATTLGEEALNDAPLEQKLISLGIEEALPTQEEMDELHEIFFTKVHHSCPVLHKGRYLTSLILPPSQRPPLALRYAVWTLAALASDKYRDLQSHYYRRARRYIEELELRGHGERIISMGAVQAWCIIANYEFKLMYFPRAWMSTGRAVRLAQMMGLHKVDADTLNTKQAMPPPANWSEREERRRTFWVAFCIDRYASIGTGWPMMVDEQDIATHLPATDEAFLNDRPEPVPASLKEAMSPNGAALLSPFGGEVLMACLLGHNLHHLHRHPEEDRLEDLKNSSFWRRHRHLDQVLANVSLSLPEKFRLPNGIGDPHIVFTNMNIHATTICLHQAALFKAEKSKLPHHLISESRARCFSAASSITTIMRTITHLEVHAMHPFLSFCIYVAARVFISYLRNRPDDEHVVSCLQFLCSVLGQIKKTNPVTESFLVQLELDLTGELDAPDVTARFPYGLRKGQAEMFSGRNKPDPSLDESEEPETEDPDLASKRATLRLCAIRFFREQKERAHSPSVTSPSGTADTISEHDHRAFTPLSTNNVLPIRTSPLSNTSISPAPVNTQMNHIPDYSTMQIPVGMTNEPPKLSPDTGLGPAYAHIPTPIYGQHMGVSDGVRMPVDMSMDFDLDAMTGLGMDTPFPMYMDFATGHGFNGNHR